MSSSCVDFCKDSDLEMSYLSSIVCCRQIVNTLIRDVMAMGDTTSSRRQEFRLWIGRWTLSIKMCVPHIDKVTLIAYREIYSYAPGLFETIQLAYVDWPIEQ